MNSKYKTIKYKQSKPSNIEDFVSIEEPLEMVVRYKKEKKWIDNSISITMKVFLATLKRLFSLASKS